MLREELGRWIKKLFSKGANTDIEKDFLPEGEYVNAQNMRTSSVTGAAASLEAIGGEELLYPAIPEDVSQVCIGAAHVFGHLVTFWAPRTETPNPDRRIEIDGVTMVRSPLIPYQWDRPLQIAVVEGDKGGVLYPVDGNSEPLRWDIGAIIAANASGSTEYTTSFSSDNVSVALTVPVEWPEHVGNPIIGVGAPVGQYLFYLRWRTPSGDVSNSGPESPLIAVPKTQAPIYTIGIDDLYPGGQTAGGRADATSATQYGIALRFLVDNRQGFSEVEVCCRKFNLGLGVTDPGEDAVVARLGIIPGEFQYRDFVYPRDNNFYEVIPVDQRQVQQVAVDRPKTVEHVDNRVIYANFFKKNRVADLVFRAVAGARMFPFTKRLFTWYGGGTEQYNDGYSDPVNNTYGKSAMHNERYKPGLMFWDGNSAKSPVVEIGEITMPGRATRKAGDPLTYSDASIIRANDECQDLSASGIPFDPVSPSFDVIVQGTMHKEPNVGGPDFVNVAIAGGTYNPWSPTDPIDPDFVRYRVPPNTQWRINETDYLAETGHIFNPQIHALGIGIYGPSNLPEAASWAKVMTVMYPPPAGRVLLEGVGAYALTPEPAFNAIGKASNALWCSFPDAESGAVNESVIQDIHNNPQNYQVRLTPYAFKSEVYSYRMVDIPTPFAFGMDMVTYVNGQLDDGIGDFSINPGETPGTMGYQPTLSAPPSPTNYAGPGAYRHTPIQGVTDPNNQDYSVFLDPNNTDQGATLLGLAQFSIRQEGRGTVYDVRTLENMYTLGGRGPGGNFTDDQTRRYHEGMYNIQIIRKDAVVQPLNVQQYRNTGTHIVVATEGRTIALAQDLDTYDVELFHARKDDCVGYLATDYRYCYIQEQGQPERRYLCVTNNAFVIANFAAVSADLIATGQWTTPDGTVIDGVYDYIENTSSGPHAVGYLRFGSYAGLPRPTQGARIAVKYDPQAPIRALGFDCSISHHAFAPVDRKFNGSLPPDDPSQSALLGRTSLPYRGGVKNPGYNLPRGQNGSVYEFEPDNFPDNLSMRQWVVTGHVMSRTEIFKVGNPLTTIEQDRFTFPQQHYVIRSTAPSANNYFYSQYDQDYQNEALWFNMGGFWVFPLYNGDYQKQPIITGVGVPLNGQGEGLRTDYRCAYIASLRKDPLAEDTSNHRTFLEENIFPVSEENGQINRIMALDQGGFQQLWGWSEEGLHRVPYNKNILVGADGNLLATQGIENFWPREEIWIVRGSHGMPEQSWRMSVKANAPVKSGDIDTAFWVDRVSAYQLIGGRVVDIARNQFLEELQPYLTSTPMDYSRRYTAAYNRKNGEWIFGTGTNRAAVPFTYVFNGVARNWVGSFTYSFDQLLNVNTSLYGMRNGQTFELGKGYIINGETREAWLETFVAAYPGRQCEMIAWRTHPDRPDELRIYDKQHRLMLTNNEAIQEAAEAGTGQYWVMLVDSWQALMNSVDASYAALNNTPQQPPQDTGFYVRVFFRQPTPSRSTFVEVQIRPIA